MDKSPIIIEVWRGSAIESRHRVSAAVVDSSGRMVAAFGDVARPIFPRSSAKPLQSLVLIESGAADRFGLTSREIALSAASHSGTPDHTTAVAAWLKRLDLGPEALACGIHEPLDLNTARALIYDNKLPTALHHNCSGKHAGFLSVARHIGAPIEGYLNPEHPVEQRVTAVLGAMTGCDMTTLPMGIDGCGIPTFAMPLAALALALARLADPTDLEVERARAAQRVVAAMRAHPFLIGGPGRFDSEMCEATGLVSTGLISKVGAEGVHVVIAPEAKLGIAVKAEDGAMRAAELALATLLHRLNLADMTRWLNPPITNAAGLTVGRMEVLM